jgi:hypothetical protein
MFDRSTRLIGGRTLVALLCFAMGAAGTRVARAESLDERWRRYLPMLTADTGVNPTGNEDTNLKARRDALKADHDALGVTEELPLELEREGYKRALKVLDDISKWLVKHPKVASDVAEYSNRNLDDYQSLLRLCRIYRLDNTMKQQKRSGLDLNALAAAERILADVQHGEQGPRPGPEAPPSGAPPTPPSAATGAPTHNSDVAFDAPSGVAGAPVSSPLAPTAATFPAGTASPHVSGAPVTSPLPGTPGAPGTGPGGTPEPGTSGGPTAGLPPTAGAGVPPTAGAGVPPTAGPGVPPTAGAGVPTPGGTGSGETPPPGFVPGNPPPGSTAGGPPPMGPPTPLSPDPSLDAMNYSLALNYLTTAFYVSEANYSLFPNEYKAFVKSVTPLLAVSPSVVIPGVRRMIGWIQKDMDKNSPTVTKTVN